MDIEEITENYWAGKNIAELAWFLATGKIDEIPKLSDVRAMHLMQSAYIKGFTDVLGALLRSTYDESSDPVSSNRLTDFSRISLFKALKSTKIWKNLAIEAKQWLTNCNPKEVEFRERPSDEWTLVERNKFGLGDLSLSGKERVAKQLEFDRVIYQPEQKRLQDEGIRRTVLKASRKNAQKVMQSVDEAHTAADRRLYSPDQKKWKELDFYRKERLKLQHLLGPNCEANKKILTRRAKQIQSKIANSLLSKNPNTYNFLLTDAKECPSDSDIVTKISSAISLILDESILSQK